MNEARKHDYNYNFYNEKAREIKTFYKAADVLRRYGIEIKKNRCQGFCHNGKDFNMGIKEDYCKCFVCEKSFDVFEIVMFFEECDFKKAFEILGGNRKPTLTAHRKAQNIIKERERKQKDQEERDNRYWDAFGEWFRLDDNKREHAPKIYKDLDLSALTTHEFEALIQEASHPLYVEACQKIAQQKFLLDCLSLGGD